MTISRSDKRDGWHLAREGEAVVLSRRWPPRFDVSAEVLFPPVRAGRLAHQVRQDLWRALKDVRGFSPVVRVEPEGEALRVTAGGRVDGAFPRRTVAKTVSDVLNDPVARRRWVQWARQR